MTKLSISLGELIASIPVVLDCTPRECIVALSINADGLPTSAYMVARSTLLDASRATVTAAAIAEELCHDHAQRAVLVSYSDEDIRAACPALDALRLEVEFAVPRVEVLGVRGDRWFRPGCFDGDCCPPDGNAVGEVPEGLAAVISAARRRAEADSSVSQRALDAAARRCAERVSAAIAWGDALARGAVDDAATARNLAAMLDDLCVRDWVVLTILGAPAQAADDALAGFESGAVGMALDAALAGSAVPDPLVAEKARRVVERVGRAARGRRRKAATHTLAGVLDWWDGNLEAASERCDAALYNDGNYRLASLVGLAAERGIGPGWLRKVGQTAH
jgi:hypothetical protein